MDDPAPPSPDHPPLGARADGWWWADARRLIERLRRGHPRSWAVAGMALALGVAGGLIVVLTAGRADDQPAVESVVPPAVRVPTPTTAPPPLVVHVAGAVSQPGVYRLPPGARVADALAAAGGPTPAGDPTRLNLAQAVDDGSRVYLPAVREQPPQPLVPQGGDGSRTSSGGVPDDAVVDVNTATVDELDALPGVGPATAAAIVRQRENRRFDSVDDLLAVPGIGPAKLEALRDRVRT